MKKQWIVLILVVVSVLLYVGCKKTQPAQPSSGKQPSESVIKLTYANFPPAPTFPCVQMERWKTEVEKRTNNKVSVQTFPGGTLLDAKEMMDGVISGQADIGCLCMAYQPGRYVVTNATALPIGIPNSRVGSQVLWELYNKYQPKEFADVKVLTMFTTAPANIMSKKPVRTLADLKGMDLRASGEAAQILKAWGANQVGMPMSGTPEALQKGVVQGLFSSVEVMKDFKFAEICKFITLTETNIYPFAVVMNKKKWDALPDEVQKVLEELSAEQCVWTGEYMDAHVQESIDWSKTEQGVEVIPLSADQLAEWNALLEPNITEWLESARKAGLPGDEILAGIKTSIKNFSAQ